MPTTPPSTPVKSRNKPKPSECFNDPAFLALFSQQLHVVEERLKLNKPVPRQNPSPSLQDGLATPPDPSINLPDNLDGSQADSPVIGEDEVVCHESTTGIQASCDSTTTQTRALPAIPSQSVPQVEDTPPAHWQNMTPTSRASYRKKNKFYVVTRGRRTGVFNSWFVVEPLVHRIPGNCHASFESYEVALEEYEVAKRRGDLRVIWITVQDAITYGPEKGDAIM